MAILGYARVSTDGQDLGAQVAALTDAGCARVFREKASGARSDRAELARLLRSIGAGDTLVVTRLDRLARSTRDLLNVLHAVSERGAAFRSLADAWCDTSSPHGELMVTVLAGLATFERHLIRSRTEEGRRLLSPAVRASASHSTRFHQPRAAECPDPAVHSVCFSGPDMLGSSSSHFDPIGDIARRTPTQRSTARVHQGHGIMRNVVQTPRRRL